MESFPHGVSVHYAPPPAGPLTGRTGLNDKLRAKQADHPFLVKSSGNARRVSAAELVALRGQIDQVLKEYEEAKAEKGGQ